jgi:hypothetical protein
MLRWLGRGSDQPAQMPGGLAVATQQLNRAHDRERELRQHQQRRQGWLEANATSVPSIGRWCGPWPGSGAPPAWRSKLTARAMCWRPWGQLPSRPGADGPGATRPPKSEHYRRSYQITDPDRALGPEPHHPAQRAVRHRVRTAIERVHAKQRAAIRSGDAQPTSECPTQPRPRDQGGRPGPERAAG